MNSCLTIFITSLILQLCLKGDNENIKDYKLNQISQKACHNCFERKYVGSLYTALEFVKAIEIDIYDSKNIINRKGAVAKHWYVRHEGSNKQGNNNCCYSSILNGNDLDSCLKDIASWCYKNPKHDLITVFLDKKQSWTINHYPKDLDQLILKYFSEEEIFKPSNLKGGFENLKAAAKANNWPKIEELRGKVLFALTGGNLLQPNKTLAQYVEKRKDSAIIFVAPQIKHEHEIYNHPKYFSEYQAQYAVVYNLNIKNADLSCVTMKENYLSRVFNSQEDSVHYSEQQACANYIAVFGISTINAKQQPLKK